MVYRLSVVRIQNFGNAESLVDRIEDCAVLLFRLAQGFFRLFSLGDVEHGPDIPEKLTVWSEARVFRIDGPAIFAVVAPQAIVETERDLFFVGVQENAPGTLAIVGMNRVEPAEPVLTKSFLLRLPGEFVPPARKERARAVRFSDPEHGLSDISQIAKVGFALSQFLGG